jgi:hypothetical protein
MQPFLFFRANFALVLLRVCNLASLVAQDLFGAVLGTLPPAPPFGDFFHQLNTPCFEIEEVGGPLAFFVSISLPFIFNFPPAFWEGETVP